MLLSYSDKLPGHCETVLLPAGNIFQHVYVHCLYYHMDPYKSCAEPYLKHYVGVPWPC